MILSNASTSELKLYLLPSFGNCLTTFSLSSTVFPSDSITESAKVVNVNKDLKSRKKNVRIHFVNLLLLVYSLA